MKTDADKLRSFLKQVAPTLETYGKKSIVSEIDKAITTTEDSATVLFCGEFKRGKSSLVNAIIGTELCPTDIGIATSVVTTIKYDAVKKAVRYYGNLLENADSLKSEEIEWEDIDKYTMGDVLEIDNTILVVYTGPPIALVAFWVIRAIWKDSWSARYDKDLIGNNKKTMKIKSIENFSLEECREYLNTHPNGTERSAVEDRLNAILQQKKYNEEQKEKQRRLERERLAKDVRWIDFKQFLSDHKYRKSSGAKIIVWLLLLFAVFMLSASFYYSETPHIIYAKYCDEQDSYTTGVERLLLEICFIDTPYRYREIKYPCYEHYDLEGTSLTTLNIIILAILNLIIIKFYHSPSLLNIYNIEQDEKTKSIRRTQNIAGKFGLHLCKKHRIIQLLSIEYDNIYYCGGNAYICVKGNKSGVYNAQAKKMVINIEYDSIEIAQNGTLLVSKDGVHSKLTTDGYRIIE